MNDSGRRFFVAVVAAAAALMALRRRPVKPPQHSGSWRPVERGTSRPLDR